VSEPGLPRSWREAIPYIVWVVLILGFGLEFTTSIVHAAWLSAFISFCAMAGLTTVTLHWPQLRSWAAGISPNWLVGSFALLLVIIALLPFVEQKRWPFSAWFVGRGADVKQEQRATLIEWLQQAQRERDQAIGERNQARQQLVRPSPTQERPAILDQTARMSLNDKGRLSDALFEIERELEQGRNLQVRAQRKLDPRGGANLISTVAADFDGTKNDIQEMVTAAGTFERDSAHLRDKYKYYELQITYIFGSSPDNDAMTGRNALLSLQTFLEKWGAITNRQDPNVVGLLSFAQRDFAYSIDAFTGWLRGCEERLQQMRAAIQ
jgi:hypothetical protein